jgi:hypothetical protein
MSAGYPTQPRFGASPFNQPPRKSGMGWVVSLLLIGLGIVMIGGAVCIGGVWYVASNIDRWVVGLGREAIVAAINDSELPQEEKAEVITQVDRIVTAYKERKINQDDLQRVFTELQDSPALAALALYGIENEYLNGTNLSKDEIEQGRRTFQRALRAVYEGKISQEAFFTALPDDEAEMSTDDVEHKTLQERVRLAANKAAETSPDDDLRLTLTQLKVMADNAGIPNEPFQLHIGEEVKKLVDKALAGK